MCNNTELITTCLSNYAIPYTSDILYKYYSCYLRSKTMALKFVEHLKCIPKKIHFNRNIPTLFKVEEKDKYNTAILQYNLKTDNKRFIEECIINHILLPSNTIQYCIEMNAYNNIDIILQYFEFPIFEEPINVDQIMDAILDYNSWDAFYYCCYYNIPFNEHHIISYLEEVEEFLSRKEIFTYGCKDSIHFKLDIQDESKVECIIKCFSLLVINQDLLNLCLKKYYKRLKQVSAYLVQYYSNQY